jgi:phytoene desaturase
MMAMSEAQRADPDVLIVGAGPGGLASAMLLAHSGLDVLVVEKCAEVGGRTKIIEQDGFRFDRGPTFFHYPEIIEEIFQAIGLDAHKELGLIPLDPSYKLVFGQGGSIEATSDLDEMTERVRSLSGEENASGFRKYVTENRRKLTKSKSSLQSPWNGVSDLFSRKALEAASVMRPWATVASDLKRLFPDERIRLAMSFQTKYLGMSPFQAPSLFTILAFLEYEHGIFHAKGGLGSITERMADIAIGLGADIQLSTPVEELLLDGKRVVGVRTEKGEIRCDKVIMNADFANGMTSLVPNDKRRRWSDKKLAKKSYSCSTFMLYLGTDKTWDQPHHQIYASSKYESNLEDITKHRVTWEDPSIYVQNACITDPSLAPDGCSTLYVLVPVSNVHESIEWDSIKDDYRDVIIKQMEKLGFAGLEDHIVSESIVTPDDWGSSDIYRGAVFNLAHSLDQMLFLRPGNRFDEFQGLYLVGGGTHPGSGLPTIFESGRITSKLVLADMGIHPEWNGVDTWFPYSNHPVPEPSSQIPSNPSGMVS